jgi:ApaG protein
VQVTTKYLPERSSPRDSEYMFAYFIRISNVGSETAKLLTRHWVITYNSFCHLKTPVGTMHGEYTMVTPSGETFEARIAPFTLAVPNALN